MSKYTNFDLRKFLAEGKKAKAMGENVNETSDYVSLAKQTFDGNPQVVLTHGDPSSIRSDKPMHGLSLKLALNYIRNNADASAIENGDVYAEVGPDGVLRITIGDQEFDIKKDENVGETAPGFEHDCAAHVVHETYGYGVCIEGRHTLVENTEGKHEVTHYDVFFKSGDTIENIPVNELKILTSESHSHGKKKKNEGEVEEGKAQQVMQFLTNLFDKVTGIDKFNECSNNDWQGEECQKLKQDIGYAAGVKSGFEKQAGTSHLEETKKSKEEAFKKQIKDILDS